MGEIEQYRAKYLAALDENDTERAREIASDMIDAGYRQEGMELLDRLGKSDETIDNEINEAILEAHEA